MEYILTWESLGASCLRSIKSLDEMVVKFHFLSSRRVIQFDGAWSSCQSSGSGDALQDACGQGT